MIIIKNIESYNIELQEILNSAVAALHEKSKRDESLLKLSGIAFEKVVCDTLNSISINTAFYEKFEQSTALAFPDIYVKILENKWFGIEVKTSQGDWKCFGNSIFETTRIENLEDRIYVFFGRFSKSALECRWAKYDECIDNINITHSPRYQINMDIKGNPQNSVFAKMEITYLDFSNSNATNRMDYVRKFKRKGLGQNAALWWLPDNDSPNNDDEEKLVIKLFKSLSQGKRQEIRSSAMAFFPEVFSNDQLTKYSRILTWLASHYGVVTGSLRDEFSAGGKFEVDFKGNKFKLPRICFHLNSGVKQIQESIYNSTIEDLTYRWQLSSDVSFSNQEQKLIFWIGKTAENLKQQSIPDDFPIIDWLNSLFLK